MAETYGIGGGRIFLGRRNENLARALRFDLSEFVELCGNGSAQLLHQRAGDETPYIVTAERAGNLLTWVPSAADTGKAGRGRAELRWYVGSVLAKSAVYDTMVAESMPEPGSTPAAVETALELLAERVESAAEDVAAARAAKTAAQAAQAAAETARGAAQEAAGNAALSAAAAHTDALGASGSAEVAADKALSAATDAGVAEEAAGEAAESAEAAERARDAAQSARGGAEASRDAAAGNAGAAAQSAQGAAGSAAAAAAAQTAAGAARDAAAQKAAEAAQSAAGAAAARTAAETAQGAAETAKTDAETACQDIQDSVDGVAQELTAQQILARLGQILPVLVEIAEAGSDAGSLNGFGLELDGEDNGVVLTYTDPDTGAELAREKLATDSTGQDEAVQLRRVNAALRDYFTG